MRSSSRLLSTAAARMDPAKSGIASAILRPSQKTLRWEEEEPLAGERCLKLGGGWAADRICRASSPNSLACRTLCFTRSAGLSGRGGGCCPRLRGIRLLPRTWGAAVLPAGGSTCYVWRANALITIVLEAEPSDSGFAAAPTDGAAVAVE